VEEKFIHYVIVQVFWEHPFRINIVNERERTVGDPKVRVEGTDCGFVMTAHFWVILVNLY